MLEENIEEAQSNALSIGSMLEEFEILSILGAGGFGITYKVKDTNLNKIMVIKEYMPNAFASRSNNTTVTCISKDRETFEWGLERFLDEARTLSSFDHISIVKAHRFFEANNTAYFVMDFYEGETLEDYLKKHPNKQFNQDEILSVMMPIIEGLKAVHNEGFLHRDIAPDNIFLRQTKPPILIDFGASRNALGVQSQNISAIVKHGYSPPEQYTSSSNQDETTDLYAISAVIYQMITGVKPPESTHRQTEAFNGDSDPIEDIEQIYKDKFRPSFLKTVAKGLSLRQKDRVQSIKEFQEGLVSEDEIEEDEPKDELVSKKKTIAITKKIETPKDTTPNTPTPNTTPQKSIVMPIVIMVLVIVIIGLGLYSYKQSQEAVITPEQNKITVDNEKIKLQKELERLKQEKEDRDRKEHLVKLQKEKEELLRLQHEKEERDRKEQLEKIQREKDELKRLREEKEAREREEEFRKFREEEAIAEAMRKKAQEPIEKTSSFNENGIYIKVKYPSFVRAGDSFELRAEMTNNTKRAKQGGLTLSFPDMNSMSGSILRNNFSDLNGYSSPQKIYNKNSRRNMTTQYFMVEGWQKNTWSYGQTKYFSVQLTAPQSLDNLRVNLRGILWIRGKHDTREIPYSSSIYDQQGFAVKRFSIDIRR